MLALKALVTAVGSAQSGAPRSRPPANALYISQVRSSRDANKRQRMSHANGASRRSGERACRGVRGAKLLAETVVESEGANERERMSHANGASRRSGERESVQGSSRGEAPQREIVLMERISEM